MVRLSRHGRLALFAVAVVGSSLLSPVHPAAAQDRSPPLKGVRVLAEVGAGVLGAPVGFLGGGLLTRWSATRLGASEERASHLALVGAWTAAALVTAAGPTIVGTRGPVTGSYAAAVAGTLAGGAISYVLVRLNDRDRDHRPCRLLCSLSAVGVFLMPSIGATVGFNLSRRYER